MALPVQVVFRNMKTTPWIVDLVHERAEKLEHFCNHILSLRVAIEIPHKHHHTGNHFRVSILIRVPEREIVVKRDPAEHEAAKDINAVLNDSFDSARIQLQDYVRMQREK